jgi:hypothetical protein
VYWQLGAAVVMDEKWLLASACFVMSKTGDHGCCDIVAVAVENKEWRL